MIDIIRADLLKNKRTLGSRFIFIFPAITLIMAFILTMGMTNAYSESVWNWWYTLILPGMLAILSYLSIDKERKTGYFHMTTLTAGKRKMMLGKIIYLGIITFIANLVLFTGASIGGFFLSTSVPIGGAAVFVLVLTLTQLWQIPVYLYLSMRFGMLADLICSLIITVAGIIVAPSKLWFVFTSAISMRTAVPLIHVLPNGLRAEAGNPMINYSVLPIGLLSSALALVILTALFLRWFEKREVR